MADQVVIRRGAEQAGPPKPGSGGTDVGFEGKPRPIRPPYVPGWSDRTSPVEPRAQNIFISGSAKGWPIPYIYGSTKVAGQLIAAHLSTTYLYLVYLLSEGELSSISNIKLNDIAIASFSGYVSHQSYVGAASQTIDSVLNAAITSWSSTHNAGLVAVTGRSTGRAYAWVKINTAQASVPGIPTLTATVTRGSVNDWSSTSRASTNPAVALWDYLNKHTGLASGDIDTTSWDAVRTWCDTDPGDGTALWSLNIALTGSSDRECTNEIMKHFFGSMAWYDGKLYLSARRTLSSATLTIGPSEIVRPLTWSRVPLHQRPNYVDVIYTDSTSLQQQKKNSAASGINRNSTNCRAIEVNLPGCTVASMAKRYAEQYRKLLTNETLLVDFSITSVGVSLNPGDRVDVTTPTGMSSQSIRVETISALESGEYVIRGTSYDSTAQSTTTDTAASVPSTTVPTTNVVPATPTSVSGTIYSLTLTDQFGNDISYSRFVNSWTAGSGGDAVSGWAFECRDPGDADPDSTIARSLDILYVPGATSCIWTNDFNPDYFAYEANFPKSTPWPGVSLAGYECRVIAIGEHGGEAASSWATIGASAMSPQTAPGAFIDLGDTPAAYTGNAGKLLRVDSTPDAIEFVALADLGVLAYSGCKVYLSSDETITDGSGEYLAWDAEEWDTDSYWASGNATRITIPATGYYRFDVNLIWDGANLNAAYRAYFQFRVNGSTTLDGTYTHSFFDGNGVLGQNATTNGTLVLSLTASDYVELYVYQRNSGSVDELLAGGSSGVGTWMAVQRIY